MTASKTPNLQLMLPVNSDPFDPLDFSDTFSKLDLHPGVRVIPNQAARPSGLGAANHGRMFWQADQNIMWIWTQPSPVVAGYWDRQGTKGWLGGDGNVVQGNTTAQSVAPPPTGARVSA